MEDSFRFMRLYSNKGPLVNSEFYPGWLSHWEEKMQRVNTDDILDTMTQMFERNASFNFYMFFGGTNFGFKNGTYRFIQNIFKLASTFEVLFRTICWN